MAAGRTAEAWKEASSLSGLEGTWQTPGHVADPGARGQWQGGRERVQRGVLPLCEAREEGLGLGGLTIGELKAYARGFRARVGGESRLTR